MRHAGLLFPFAIMLLAPLAVASADDDPCPTLSLNWTRSFTNVTKAFTALHKTPNHDIDCSKADAFELAKQDLVTKGSEAFAKHCITQAQDNAQKTFVAHAAIAKKRCASWPAGNVATAPKAAAPVKICKKYSMEANGVIDVPCGPDD